MDYFQLQEAVFNHLWNKHQQDNSFTFSVRQVAKKGAEKNYFIGTEKSGYFGFTCWDIPVYYPGSSSDLTNFIFWQDGAQLFLKFQYIMTKSATDPQSVADLAFGYELLKNLQSAGVKTTATPGENKMLYFQVFAEGARTVEALLQAFETLYNQVAPHIDNAVKTIRPQHPGWQAGRYTQVRFEKIISKMHERIEKFSNATQSEIETLPEEPANDFDAQVKTAGIRYFLGGAVWNGNEDQTERFVEDGVWENGYDEKFTTEIKEVPVGSLIAIKSSFAKGRESILRIKAIGTVTSNPNDGKGLKVDWDSGVEPFDLSGLGGYRQTFHEVLNQKDINVIFYRKEGEEPLLDEKSKPMPALNTILYGPPGTGKTYHTVNKAVSIANPQYEFEGKSRGEIKEEYNRLCAAGQIQFVTFHQSLSYEDFIEGIKPVEPKETDAFLKYETRDGIFKRLVKQATYIPDVQEAGVYLSDDEFSKAFFYSLTLNSALQAGDKTIYRYCIDYNCIALNVAEGIDAAGKSEAEIKASTRAGNFEPGEGAALSKFVHHLKQGHYVLLCDGDSTCRAIGKVTGDYQYKPNDEVTPDHFRSVAWLVKDAQIPREQLYAAPFTYGIERLDRDEVKKEYFTKKTVAVRPEGARKNVVLIIDEINRGNVSQIFGELITLIEEDKRQGRSEALTAILPYSKSPFSVPDNLYIIGTMNTADRSVEALDTALRRRFVFEEMPPQPALVAQTVPDLDLPLLLQTINRRLEVLLSKDHTIGHAWLMDVYSLGDLQTAFKNRLLPLLQEYFYNNYEKIALVLGTDWIETKSAKGIFPTNIASSNELKADYEEKDVFILKNPFDMGMEAFQSIYA